jgi:hypothetical protein
MTPDTIIRQATAEGVTLALSTTGTLKATGEQDAVNRWLPIIKEQKAGVVKTLLEQSALTGDLPAIRAWLAFIGEFDPERIGIVLNQCRTDPEALDYFMRRSEERN